MKVYLITPSLIVYGDPIRTTETSLTEYQDWVCWHIQELSMSELNPHLQGLALFYHEQNEHFGDYCVHKKYSFLKK